MKKTILAVALLSTVIVARAEGLCIELSGFSEAAARAGMVGVGYAKVSALIKKNISDSEAKGAVNRIARASYQAGVDGISPLDVGTLMLKKCQSSGLGDK